MFLINTYLNRHFNEWGMFFGEDDCMSFVSLPSESLKLHLSAKKVFGFVLPLV